MRKCSKCKVVKEYSEFFKEKRKKDGYGYLCKACSKLKQQSSGYYKRHKMRIIEKKYSITESGILEMYNSQNKQCKICKNNYLTISDHQGLYIDHCHETGKVRGLLCANCNKLLGNAKDNINILQSAIIYLKQSNRDNH